MLPYRPQPVRIQRWSMRRLGLTLWVLLMAVAASLVAVELLGGPL
jgi:hypothetical protein